MDSYLSYLRNMFGSSSHHHAPGQRPSHSRSQSASTAPAYVYTQQAHSASAPRPSTAPSRQRANSYQTSHATRPSPLRYQSNDSYTSHHSIPVDPRPSVQRHGSYGGMPPARTWSPTSGAKRTLTGVHYPYFAGSTRSTSSRSAYSTPASSRSNSTSSLHPGFPHSAAPVPKSAKRVRYADERPPLKQNHSWHPTPSVASAPACKFSPSHPPLPLSNRRACYCPPLNMHPLLAHTRFHHAPISYDVVYTPSARTVVDRTTRQPVPTHTLTQPATEPPIATTSQLVLTSDKFPWPVVVGASTAFPSKSARPLRPRSPQAISNLDVLYALHATLFTRVTPQEWDGLGHGSRAQRRVTHAYEKRCAKMGGGWDGGVRRIDWLGGRTRLVGVEMDKSRPGPYGKLVFEKA
ncbi:hypothetical protein GLOTRDRAFT_107870 [Gloeophyllum trabeum ATCC 11539]|uniref:DUF6699 domain-containing protein n=1 Tax=Gloeophyllum trabeum (strain ATCC 11539 / FP-39264 / Madison 617) TaxID=670483 RepID=S7PW07_GLOTA|nr:uncharacterized protein GLOTRDRAFT_107870 [Gloeophyllum trabeum ATCC 11539]EPQ51703.1 hypothetical protein GLOTRDRAFT_107870 [Gloeophyllum trabeum ATCC 11539]